MRAGRRRRLRQPRAAEAVARQADQRSRRGVRHRAGLRRDAAARPLRRRSSRRPPAGPSTRSTPTSSTRCGSAPTSCSACACRPTPPSTRPSPWPGRSTAPAPAGFVNAVMRRISERDPTTWVDLVDRRATDPVERLAALRTSTRCGSSKALRAALIGHGAADRRRRRRRALTALLDEPTTRRPRSSLVARPGLASRRRARGCRRRALRRSAPSGRAARGRPGRHRGGPRRAGPPCRTRARSWSPSRCAAAAVEGDAAAGRALARPVRRPRRQGRAARRACAVERRDPSSPTRSASTAPSWSGRRSRGASGRAARPIERQGRAPATAARSARTSPAAYDRVLVDAPCTGLGALRRRPEARWRRTPGDVADLAGAAARAARLRRSTRPRPAASSATRRAARTSTRPASSSATSSSGATTSSSSTRGRCSSTRPGAPLAGLGEGRTSSCGRTCTAPTRCSSPCCASAPDRRRGVGPLGCARADLTEHPVRRLRQPRGRAAADRQRRLGPRRRDGRPLRAQPDPRPAGRRGAAQGQPDPARLPPDDRGPRPLGAAVRRGRRASRDLPHRGGRATPGRWRATLRAAGARAGDGAQARHRRSRPTRTCCPTSTWCWS